MPLSDLQSEILRALAAQRSPESYVAGSTPLHRDGPGYSPESLIAEIRRNARYRADEYEVLAMAEPIDAGAVARRLRTSLQEAEDFVRALPAGKEGLVFLKNDHPVQPDPAQLDACLAFEGRRQGIWPGSSEIGQAMLERYGKPP